MKNFQIMGSEEVKRLIEEIKRNCELDMEEFKNLQFIAVYIKQDNVGMPDE